MRLLIAAAVLAASGMGSWGAAALAAQPVVLRQNVTDEDGRITLGELFDGAGPAASVVVATVRPGANAVLDAATVQRRAMAAGLSWANEAGLRRVIVRPGGEAASARGVEALTYARSLAAGETIGASDLAWTKVAGMPAGAPRDSAAVIGMAAKRPLRAGQTVSMNDVGVPDVIKKDDIIAVSYSTDGVSLTLQAKALQAAGTGDVLNVMNPASKKIIQALAIGPGQAVVGPQAQQARASQAFASLR
jgi:flagella basal body P-ring formation protein FlgA